MQILFYFLTCICLATCKLTIKDAGVATLSRGDIGMIFYITLNNLGTTEYCIEVKMVKCCETFGKGDMDCEFMKLMGGDMGCILPETTKNISLLYPNMYLHNRMGQCLISINPYSGYNISSVVQKKISFDTFITASNTNLFMQGYYDIHEYTKCKSIDLDPLDQCQPLNCHMKYLGSRNFFNRKWNRCQKVPICISDPEKELPDVSYLPISNLCCDLDNLINMEDLKYLNKGTSKQDWLDVQIPELSLNLRCHHGCLSNDTGFCVCEEGWMSAPLDKDQYEPSLSIYHMCNIEIETWKTIHSTRIKMTALIIVILAALIATAIILISFLCHLIYKLVKSKAPGDRPFFDREASFMFKAKPKEAENASLVEPYQQKQVERIRRHTVAIGEHHDSVVLQQNPVSAYQFEQDLPVIEQFSKAILANLDSDDDSDTEDDEILERSVSLDSRRT